MGIAYPSPNELGQKIQALALTPRLTAAPSDPAVLSSSTTLYKMSGIAQSFTPNLTGNFMVMVTGWVASDTGSDGALIQIAYGTGTAPSINGAAAGTQTGAIFTSGAVGTTAVFYTIMALVVGIPGTTYWLDLATKAVTGGNVNLTKVNMLIVEI